MPYVRLEGFVKLTGCIMIHALTDRGALLPLPSPPPPSFPSMVCEAGNEDFVHQIIIFLSYVVFFLHCVLCTWRRCMHRPQAISSCTLRTANSYAFCICE